MFGRLRICGLGQSCAVRPLQLAASSALSIVTSLRSSSGDGADFSCINLSQRLSLTASNSATARLVSLFNFRIVGPVVGTHGTSSCTWQADAMDRLRSKNSKGEDITAHNVACGTKAIRFWEGFVRAVVRFGVCELAMLENALVLLCVDSGMVHNLGVVHPQDCLMWMVG